VRRVCWGKGSGIAAAGSLLAAARNREALAMKRLVLAVVAVSAVAAGSAGSGGVPALGTVVPAVGSWGRAIEVPGLGALNKGGYAPVTSLSCASAGSCAAGGFYVGSSGNQHGFVAVERRGVCAPAAPRCR
jgi:hypothetical protein